MIFSIWYSHITTKERRGGKMKIGMSIELREPQHISGVTVSVNSQIEFLQLKGHKVNLFSPRVPGYRGTANLPVIPLPSYKWDGKYWAKFWLQQWQLCGLERIVRDSNFDAIHFHGHYGSDLILSRLARKLRIPCIATYHTDSSAYIDARVKDKIGRYLAHRFDNSWFREIKSCANCFIAPSNYAKELLFNLSVPEEKIVILPTPIDIPDNLPTREKARQDLCLPQGKKILLYVGRLAEEKNPRMMLEAFALVARENKDVILILVGGGEYDIFGIAERLGIKDRIIITGSKEHKDVWQYYASADIFVFPSVTETQGIAIQEAMGVGLPTVAVKKGGASEAIIDNVNGIVVGNDAQQFTNGVLDFLTQKEFAQKCSEAATKTINAQFSSEVIYTKMIEIYEKLVRSAK